MPRQSRLPNSIFRPASCPNTSFIRNGTPRKGPLPRRRVAPHRGKIEIAQHAACVVLLGRNGIPGTSFRSGQLGQRQFLQPLAWNVFALGNDAIGEPHIALSSIQLSHFELRPAAIRNEQAATIAIGSDEYMVVAGTYQWREVGGYSNGHASAS